MANTKKCKCITEVEKKAANLLHKKHDDGNVHVINVSLREIGFSLSGGGVTFTTVDYQLEKTNRDVVKKPVKKTINMYHTYCPFCGKPYPKLK